jgi:hypothetical protein
MIDSTDVRLFSVTKWEILSLKRRLKATIGRPV